MIHPVLGFISVAGAILIFTLAILNEYFTGALLRSRNMGAIQANNSASSALRNAEVVQRIRHDIPDKRRWFDKHRGYRLTDGSRREGGFTCRVEVLAVSAPGNNLGDRGLLCD